MVGEGGSRGAALEMCLAKLLHAAPTSQIVAMSATLSNIEDLKTFLRAQVYSNDFRPVGRTTHFVSQYVCWALASVIFVLAKLTKNLHFL